MYHAEATSVAAFVQQLAVSYLSNGYWFYVRGMIPANKDPCVVDAKLVDRYRIDISKWTRVRRKRSGIANLHYLRYERTFLLLATHGIHRFFEEEKNSLCDARRVPIRFEGYSISFRGGHAHVRIAQERFQELKSYYTELATRRPKEVLEEELGRIPFEPYAPFEDRCSPFCVPSIGPAKDKGWCRWTEVVSVSRGGSIDRSPE